MKQIIGILFLVFLFSGCSKRNVKPDFEFIEFSVWNEMGGSTVRLDSNRQLIRCKYKIIKNIESFDCYIDTIDGYVLDTINQFLFKIRTQKIDSIYNSHCQDCPGYLLKIKTKQFELLTQVREILNDKVIDSLVQYLRSLPLNKINRVDSCYIYETTKFLIPPKLILQ